MKRALLLLALTVPASAQSSADKPSERIETASAGKVDPKLHSDAMKLVEVTGTRERFQATVKQRVRESAQQMMEKCKRCTAEFAEEWEKRFAERINVDDFLDLYARVYEKYFTDAEICELILLQKEKETSKTPKPSPALEEKLKSVMPLVKRDYLSGCSRIGEKLGGDIGSEIEHEHPEYIKSDN